ncbi:MAG TPA: methionyl-tRNA formyltransferase [Candidatus Saccharimonadales bacterium]|nr:methionyl-tRNA formyltransferase [Candidatus Saccharimonadales bacterium]
MNESIVFFGNERIATGTQTTAPTLRALIAAGYHVAAVVIAQREVANSRQIRPLEVVEIAEAHTIPVLRPEKLSAVVTEIADYQATAGVLVAFGKMVPQALIDIFPRGIINIHPSLLPKHRGSTPIESTILQGDAVTGVSLMALVAQMDAGPVFAQTTVELEGREAKQALADTLLNLGKDLVIEHLPAILDGTLKPTAQDDSQATYDQLIQKTDGELDFTKPAVQLEREIRAFTEWPKSRTKLGETEVVVTFAQVTSDQLKPSEVLTNNKKLLVGTSDGSLEILRLKPAGKGEMTAQAFLAGYGQQLT